MQVDMDTQVGKLQFPPGWEEFRDVEGRVYYGNSETGESSWDLPKGNGVRGDAKVRRSYAGVLRGSTFARRSERSIESLSVADRKQILADMVADREKKLEMLATKREQHARWQKQQAEAKKEFHRKLEGAAAAREAELPARVQRHQLWLQQKEEQICAERQKSEQLVAELRLKEMQEQELRKQCEQRRREECARRIAAHRRLFDNWLASGQAENRLNQVTPFEHNGPARTHEQLVQRSESDPSIRTSVQRPQSAYISELSRPPSSRKTHSASTLRRPNSSHRKCTSVTSGIQASQATQKYSPKEEQLLTFCHYNLARMLTKVRRPDGAQDMHLQVPNKQESTPDVDGAAFLHRSQSAVQNGLRCFFSPAPVQVSVSADNILLVSP